MGIGSRKVGSRTTSTGTEILLLAAMMRLPTCTFWLATTVHRETLWVPLESDSNTDVPETSEAGRRIGYPISWIFSYSASPAYASRTAYCSFSGESSCSYLDIRRASSLLRSLRNNALVKATKEMEPLGTNCRLLSSRQSSS